MTSKMHILYEGLNIIIYYHLLSMVWLLGGRVGY